MSTAHQLDRLVGLRANSHMEMDDATWGASRHDALNAALAQGEASYARAVWPTTRQCVEESAHGNAL